MGDILGDDEQVVEAVLGLQFAKVGENLAHQLLGLAVDPEAVLELVIFLGYHCVIFGCKNPGGQDRHFLVFAQQRHCRQCGLGPDRSSDNEIGLFVQNEFFNRQQGFAHRNAGLQVNDLLVQLNGQEINSMFDVRSAMLGRLVGERVEIVVLREGSESTEELQLEVELFNPSPVKPHP